ncbi:hypothetical protein GYH30_025089 [Glycine max]|nr:hypothetical protein GYH30_025089 [Glycine max]
MCRLVLRCDLGGGRGSTVPNLEALQQCIVVALIKSVVASGATLSRDAKSWLVSYQVPRQRIG